MQTGRLMSDEWEMIVRVRLRNCMDHDVLDAEQELRAAIRDEGGPMSVVCGWCDSDDIEIVSLKPTPATPSEKP